MFFRDNVGRPQHTILVAASLGTFVGFKSMEQCGGIYDGALCLRGAGSGATRLWDSVPAYLAYDVIFGVPASWGTVGELRNDLDFETEGLAKSGPELSNIANFPSLNLFDSSPRRLVAVLHRRHHPIFYPGWGTH